MEKLSQATANNWQDEAIADFEKGGGSTLDTELVFIPNKDNLYLNNIEDNQLTDESIKYALKTLKMESVVDLENKLNEAGEFPNKEKWVKLWAQCILRYGVRDIEIFVKNVSRNELLRDALSTTDFDVLAQLIDPLGEKILDEPDEIRNLIQNIKERKDEVIKNRIEIYNRIHTNPIADKDEYRAGTYRESIESQVREAVFELIRRGYPTMGSGFYNLAVGSQCIVINKDNAINPQVILDNINLSADKRKLIGKILLEITDDQLRLILIPRSKMLSLKDWKQIWDETVSRIPALDSQLKRENSDNGLQGVGFREAQDRMKEGKNAWLSRGIAYVNGKVVDMKYEDFAKL